MTAEEALIRHDSSEAAVTANDEPVVVLVNNTVVTAAAAVRTEEDIEHCVPPLLLPRWYPVGCCNGNKPVYYGNREALGWALDSVGRSAAFIGSGVFLGTALLRLAKQAAGCAVDPLPGTDEVPECNNRIYGIRPSSLLTTYTIVVGVLSATLLPFMGALVDYTKHRRLIGRYLSVTFCVLLLAQIFLLSEKTWLVVAVLQIGVAFAGWAQTMVVYAYLPELTDSAERLNQYTQSFTLLSFAAMVIYLVVTVGIGMAAGIANDSIAMARLGTAISVVVSSSFMYVAWGHLMLRRPRAHDLPVGQSLWTAGFVQVYRTSIHIYHHLPALKWFYVSIAMIDASVNSLATIMVTYLTDTLGFSSTENGIAIFSMLVGSIPGAVVAGKTVTRFNPVRSNRMATLLLAVNTIVASIVLTGREQKFVTYIVFAVWGLGVGWKWTTDRLLASILIPTGQDAELMGVYLFAGQVLTWIPPLIFTAMNEAGVDQSISIGTLSIYFVLGLIALLMISDYEKAISQTGRRSDVRTEEVSPEGRVTDDVAETIPSDPKNR